MNRRKFIKKSGTIGAIALLPTPLFSMSEGPNYKMGYQLFSICDEMAKDPIMTLKALKAIGYEDFEAYGFDSEKEMLYGYQPTEFKKILNDVHLSVSSDHYGFSSYLEKSEMTSNVLLINAF